MAGRPHRIRSIKSYVNNIDAHTFAGPMKSGTSPSIGVAHHLWHNYKTQCNQNPNQIKKSYNNMVFLNINPAQTPVTAGFRPTTNYNYSYNANNSFNANAQYDNHYFRPYKAQTGKFMDPSKHMTGFTSNVHI
jgi:hypothetical protein